MQFLLSFLLFRDAVSSQYAGLVLSAETSLIVPAFSVVCAGRVSSGHDACRYSLFCTGWSAVAPWIGPANRGGW